jgi:uncharacterized pyridoxal phosphate-containing UPF0001 family protein
MTPSLADSIAQGITETVEAIAAAAREAGRDPADVQLIAVAKTHGPEAVEAALATGQRRFGENRVQEAATKYPAFRDAYPDLELHLIGGLQTNKARARRSGIVRRDPDRRPARSWPPCMAAEMPRPRVARRPDCLVQVNTGEEPQKAGVSARRGRRLHHRAARDRPGPAGDRADVHPARGRRPAAPHFALFARDRAAKQRARARSQHGDERGLSRGSDRRWVRRSVRVGTAIFGRRPPLGPA